VRIDSGVEQGDEITPHYDPMIAKLIVWGADRAQALSRMRQALAQFRVVGVQNNVEFLARLVALPAFAQGRFDTGLIEREQDALFPPGREVPESVWLIAALSELLREQRLALKAAERSVEADSPWAALDGWRLNGRAQRRLQLRLGEQVQAVTVEVLPRQSWRIGLEGGPVVEARATPGADGALLVQLGERRLHAAVIAAGERRHVFFEGRSWPLSLVDSLHVGGAGDEAEGGLRAPMPGKVIAWLAQPGAAVEKGAPLLVLEAMKMEHTITAPRQGVVKAFRYAPGEQVADGAELVEFGEPS
jgi:3-methylcrotonyl-CoA carboxylase alpha subunit